MESCTRAGAQLDPELTPDLVFGDGGMDADGWIDITSVVDCVVTEHVRRESARENDAASGIVWSFARPHIGGRSAGYGQRDAAHIPQESEDADAAAVGRFARPRMAGRSASAFGARCVA